MIHRLLGIYLWVVVQKLEEGKWTHSMLEHENETSIKK